MGQQKSDVAGHIMSEVRKQAEMKDGVQLALSFISV